MSCRNLLPGYIILFQRFFGQWNKGYHTTKESLKRIKSKVPFPIFGMHPDTGSEFINWGLKGWCDSEKIELTRSRPYHKNDNAYVEQKNGHVIRRFLGYARLDQREVVKLINGMYDLLEIYLNHFVPSQKLIEKLRVGSKYVRKYDKAKTAYKRVLGNDNIPQEIKDKLTLEHGQLNPLILKRKLDIMIEQIFKINRSLREPNTDN